MNIRRTLAVVLVAALPLTACADADNPDVSSDPATTDAPTDAATSAPADEDTDAPADEDTDAPAGDSGTEAPDAADPDDESTTDDAADEDPAASTPATAALFFNGQQVPVAEACSGADGAVIATTQGEVTIQAVREGSEPAMRYMAEGEELYIQEVTTSEVGVTTVYEGTFEPAGAEPLDVRFEVGDTSDLDDCP